MGSSLRTTLRYLYVKRAIKGKALVDFLVDHLVLDEWELNDDLLREEVFFVDILPP